MFKYKNGVLKISFCSFAFDALGSHLDILRGFSAY